MISNTATEKRRAKLYAEERDQRIHFKSFSVVIEGDDAQHTTSFIEGKWRCDCEFFQTHGRCSHTMAMERVLGSTLSEGIREDDAIHNAILGEIFEQTQGEIFELIRDVAPKMGMRVDELVGEWVLRSSKKPRPPLSDAERTAARAQFAKHIGAVDLGYPTGADNEQIDRDLGSEYASTHEDVR